MMLLNTNCASVTLRITKFRVAASLSSKKPTNARYFNNFSWISWNSSLTASRNCGRSSTASCIRILSLVGRGGLPLRRETETSALHPFTEQEVWFALLDVAWNAYRSWWSNATISWVWPSRGSYAFSDDRYGGVAWMFGWFDFEEYPRFIFRNGRGYLVLDRVHHSSKQTVRLLCRWYAVYPNQQFLLGVVWCLLPCDVFYLRHAHPRLNTTKNKETKSKETKTKSKETKTKSKETKPKKQKQNQKQRNKIKNKEIKSKTKKIIFFV